MKDARTAGILQRRVNIRMQPNEPKIPGAPFPTAAPGSIDGGNTDNSTAYVGTQTADKCPLVARSVSVSRSWIVGDMNVGAPETSKRKEETSTRFAGSLPLNHRWLGSHCFRSSNFE